MTVIGQPTGTVNQTDHERTLGQIERREVIAGPQGARAIAARHQSAYGSVWDDEWAIALSGGAHDHA
jgi:hypothetical protein